MITKHLLAASILLVLVSACQTISFSSTESSTTWAAPQPITPVDGQEFVESDQTIAWDWPHLSENQLFAAHIWYEDRAPQEVWTVENRLNIQEQIDSFNQDVGPFHWQVAVIRVSEANGFEGLDSEWSAIQTMKRVRRLSPTPYPSEQQSEIARYVLAQQLTSPTETIDFVHGFIIENAAEGSQEGYDPSFSTALLLMYAHQQGQGEKPEIWCDGRATAMLTLLQELGIESRLIFLYGEDESSGAIAEHTVLEVFNLDTQQWEVHGLLWDAYFVDTTSGQRASIERVVFDSWDTLVACDSLGNCGTERFEQFRIYYEAFRYGHSDTFWVNPDRFNVSRRFIEEDNHNLAEFLTGNALEFKIQFGNVEN